MMKFQYKYQFNSHNISILSSVIHLANPRVARLRSEPLIYRALSSKTCSFSFPLLASTDSARKHSQTTKTRTLDFYLIENMLPTIKESF